MSSQVFLLEGTSPATASTVIAATVHGLDAFDEFMIDASLLGATGGTLDVYLQRKVAEDVWVDWLHFTQLSAGGSAVSYSVSTHGKGGNATGQIVAVGIGTNSSAGTPALAAGAFVGGHPGSSVRMVFVAGALTSAGAAQRVRITGRKSLS